MKKILSVVLTLIVAFAFTACGGGSDEPDIQWKDYVEVEQYKAWQEEENRFDMSHEELEEYFQVKGVIDEDSTEDWGEGYEVYDYPGPDEDSYLHCLFKQDDEGNWSMSSISPTGVFNE